MEEASAKGDFVLSDAASAMPDGLTDLASEAEHAGIRNITTLMIRWADGSERYDRQGESLLVAKSRADGQVVGVGGLTQCPDLDDALRVRRFFVAATWRRRGIARELAEALMTEGARYTSTFTCNAKASADAGPFWESVGFVPADRPGITHVRILV